MNKLFKRLFPTKEMRVYYKMYRRHRKELIKQAKSTKEWDWCWLHYSIIMQIRHMYEYYVNGNNVWQSDESKLPIIEQLKHILDLNEEIERMETEDYGVQYIHNDDGIKAIFPDDYKERMIAHEKREQELYEELYNSIGKHLRWWWD